MSLVEQARAEAELRAEPLKVELDLDLERYRMVLPAEQRLTRDQAEPEPWELQWQDLDDYVDLQMVAVVGGPAIRNGRVEIPIDHHGFMADQVIVLTQRNPDLQNMVWSIQFRGLERGGRIVKDLEGHAAFFEATEEYAFQ